MPDGLFQRSIWKILSRTIDKGQALSKNTSQVIAWCICERAKIKWSDKPSGTTRTRSVCSHQCWLLFNLKPSFSSRYRVRTGQDTCFRHKLIAWINWIDLWFTIIHLVRWVAKKMEIVADLIATVIVPVTWVKCFTAGYWEIIWICSFRNFLSVSMVK